jgi:hypothetical protein
MPSGYQAFSWILDLKNAWWPPSIFYDFQFKKHLVIAKSSHQFQIEKTLGYH